jgi:hypothetical protein
MPEAETTRHTRESLTQRATNPTGAATRGPKRSGAEGEIAGTAQALTVLMERIEAMIVK